LRNQASPRQTLLVNSKTHGRVALYATFEDQRYRGQQ
jgi:hypothetical protein